MSRLENHQTIALSRFKDPKKIAKLIGLSEDVDPEYVEIECVVHYSDGRRFRGPIEVEDVTIVPNHVTFSICRDLPLDPEEIDGDTYEEILTDLYADALDHDESMREEAAEARWLRANGRE